MKHLPVWTGIILILFLTSCSSTSSNGKEIPVEAAEAFLEQNQNTDVLPEPVNVEPVPPPREPAHEAEHSMQAAKNSEYSKAVGDLADTLVSEDQYLADKTEVLNTIDKLSDIMKNRDYNAWLTYISPNSIRYWSNPANLIKAAARLPVKGLELKGLKDYFLYIFIPSRQNRQIDQIKYISPTLVKAVQTYGDTDIIFYHFEKIGSEWKISLDQLNN